VSHPYLVEIVDLVVRYETHRNVLDGVCLRARRGDCVAILGPSGAGKTTLFRALTGFVPAASGSIRIDSVEVKRARGKALRALRSRIGVVPQGHDLVDCLRVYHNVMAGTLGRWSVWHAIRFLIHPNRQELAEAEAALRRVGLDHKLRVTTSTLSGGEHQRVAIARALVQSPLLLLADEPVASLDQTLSEQILRLLCSLARERGLALLCSLHQPRLADRFFDRVVEVNKGQVAADREAAPVGEAFGEAV
jgi:phosphonate transport system ATP-binding protein